MEDQQLNPDPLVSNSNAPAATAPPEPATQPPNDVFQVTQAVAQPPSPPPQAVEYKIRSSLSSLIIVFLIWVIPTGLFFIVLGLIFLPEHTEPGLISLVLGIFVIYAMLRTVIAVPNKIRLEGTIISTSSLLGKRQLDLTKLSRIGTVSVAGRPGAKFYSLKLTASDGKKLYLDLGALEMADKTSLYEGLKASFNSPTVQTSRLATLVITRNWKLA